jgi:transposase
MKKSTTTATGRTGKLQAQTLTIGLNLGDRSSWYCMLHERGEVLLEQKAATTPKAMRET